MRTSGWSSRSTIIGSLFLTTLLTAFAWGQGGAQTLQNAPGIRNPQGSPQIGAVNYVEGQASIDARPLSARSVGSVDLQKGQSLTTQSGRAEILLTPGVYLRVDDNSSVSMVSPSLAPTEVELAKGRAMVEVNYIRKENDIRVDENGASTKLLKKGLYDFDADQGQVRVFKGEAVLYDGSRKISLSDGHEATLNAVKPKSKGFKTAQYEDSFYDWSGLRSAYVQQADEQLDAEYGAEYGPGWYWNPWFDGWAFPYWGFYPSFFYGGYGFFPYGYGYGGYGYHGFRGPRPGFGGRGFAGGGFRGGGGLGGGGFHGGGGFGGGHGR